MIIGEGPERGHLEDLAARLGVAERVNFHGQLAPADALERPRVTLFAMPSTEEAFGVAYVEAIAAGVPAIGCRGEPGPRRSRRRATASCWCPGDVERLCQRIDELLTDPHRLHEAGLRARATVAPTSRWEGCGSRPVAAYERRRSAERQPGESSVRHQSRAA